MTGRSDAQGVLFTGVYGAGKTSMVEEIADITEERGLRPGAIDPDWLGWIEEIERRLGRAITAGRKDDLRVAKEWIAANRGRGRDRDRNHQRRKLIPPAWTPRSDPCVADPR